MTNEEALNFLRSHQPLPPDHELDEDTIVRFDKVREFFENNPDPACIQLLLNSFGEGSGFGVYQLVGGTLLMQDKGLVIKELHSALRNPNKGIRLWSAEIASLFPDNSLLEPLVRLLDEDDFDLKYAALTALEQVKTLELLGTLTEYIAKEQEEELRRVAEEIVDDIGA